MLHCDRMLQCSVPHLCMVCFHSSKNVISSRSVGPITKEKTRKTNPSSSVDPGTFVFYQQVFPLKRFHDCFPCNNNKLSFITVVNVLFKEMNGTAYGLNQVNHSGAYVSGRRRVTLEDQEGQDSLKYLFLMCNLCIILRA